MRGTDKGESDGSLERPIMSELVEIPRTPARKRNTRLKFVVAGLIIVVAIAALGFQSFTSNSMFYLTVAEARAQAASEGDAFYARQVRINGPVHKESIVWNAKAMDLRFHLAEGQDMLPVDYKGVMPDNLQDSESVVVEGRYTPAGEFDASNILVKCPSKYEAAGDQTK